MKITTWNVNGIRAMLQKGTLNHLRDSALPDVLCLQEVKAFREQAAALEEVLPDYTGYWNAAQRPGYSGVAVYTKVAPLQVSAGLGIDRFDVEGRVLRLDFETFTLFNIYFPNGQRGQDRVGYKLDFYELLLSICDELHAGGKQVIITGDFNTAHQEMDLANPKANGKNSGFLPEERAWVTKYLESGFCDAYRRLYPTKVEYTWWTYISNARARNIGWRLDYFLVSEGLLPVVRDVVIHGDVMGSDHCPVSLELEA